MSKKECKFVGKVDFTDWFFEVESVSLDDEIGDLIESLNSIRKKTLKKRFQDIDLIASSIEDCAKSNSDFPIQLNYNDDPEYCLSVELPFLSNDSFSDPEIKFSLKQFVKDGVNDGYLNKDVREKLTQYFKEVLAILEGGK